MARAASIRRGIVELDQLRFDRPRQGCGDDLLFAQEDFVVPRSHIDDLEPSRCLDARPRHEHSLKGL